MTKLEALTALRDKVKAGGRTNDGSMFRVFGDNWTHCFDAFDGSLDAARALHDAVLPEWTVNSLHQVRQRDNGMPATGKWSCLLFCYAPKIRHLEVEADNPARAWLLAILEALIEQEQA